MNYFLFKDLETTFSPVCGCAMLNPGWKHMSRKLEEDTVLILGRKNTTLINDEGTELLIKPGRVVLLPANRFHYGIKNIEGPVSYYWIHFRQKKLPEQIDENSAYNILKNPIITHQRLENSALLPHWFDLSDPEPFYKKIQDLLIESKRDSYTNLTYNLGVQMLLISLTEVCINDAQSVQIKNSKNVQEIILFIEENLSNPNTSVKFLADKLNLNSDYLGRCFKKLMHISIGNYIVKRRVEIACNRLRETRNTCQNIAEQCGFGSLRQFYHHFKMITGKTPSEYRTEISLIYINGL